MKNHFNIIEKCLIAGNWQEDTIAHAKRNMENPNSSWPKHLLFFFLLTFINPITCATSDVNEPQQILQEGDTILNLRKSVFSVIFSLLKFSLIFQIIRKTILVSEMKRRHLKYLYK